MVCSRSGKPGYGSAASQLGPMVKPARSWKRNRSGWRAPRVGDAGSTSTRYTDAGSAIDAAASAGSDAGSIGPLKRWKMAALRPKPSSLAMAAV